MAEEAPPIKQPRCPTCGSWHPFISPCPYVKRQVTRYEPLKVRGEPAMRVEIVEVEYWPSRLRLRDQSLNTEADVLEAAKEK